MNICRLASYRPVANFHTPISFLKLSHAGFKYSGHGLDIVCEHCHKSHSLISLSNDLSPSSSDLHNFGCSQIENVIVTTNVASGAVSDIPQSDRTLYPHIREEETLGSLDLRSYEAPFNLAAHVSPLDQIPSPLNGDTPSDLPSDPPLNPPFYPLYSSIHKRIDSFQKWGYSNILDPNTLAQAGFFYAGYSDCVRCFQCGLGLRSWKLGDDVLVEHTKFRPSCSLLQSILARRHIQSTDSSVHNNSEVESRENVNENIAKVTATEFGPTEATSCTPLNERNINLVQERGLVERASTRELTDQEISDTEPSYSGLSTSPAAPSQIDYSNQMARRESFNSWSGQCPLNPDVLSLFYYFIGPDFCFKCWRCKIVIHINGDEEGLHRLRLELNEGRPICCLCYHRLPRLSSQSGVVSQVDDRGEDEDLSEET
ncbi:baculoviral IAP repeat-containing protein 2-like isoform X1 [Biomphalaria glabrata]|uniref:Baculoviral IAP repeat-containing protein 2-like isoform X1 n=1 Tax=Biomphalaria glabrata TaxID=6526 RepID=A0A9W3AS66_BIOGL|nr:baculoviral IAP repeat-containing protein 2-like isoform X1 [Biomphalaria glabrata]XP_055890009.1 baculoviral IAP repeat-containing protein 2-like isoform X1 [Biomphalaria glabrata]